MDILTGEIWLANMDLNYWSIVHPEGGDRVKGVDGGIIILASCEYYFIRVHKNLVQHSSNITSIRRSWFHVALTYSCFQRCSRVDHTQNFMHPANSRIREFLDKIKFNEKIILILNRSEQLSKIKENKNSWFFKNPRRFIPCIVKNKQVWQHL